MIGTHKIKVSKKENFKLDLMLSRLSAARKILPDRSISFTKLGEIDQYESYLRSAIVIEGMSDAFSSAIIKEAMNAEQNFTSEQFIARCRQIATAHIQNDLKDYKVAIPIWGSNGLKLQRRRWGNTSITFNIKKTTNFAQKLITERARQLEEHGDSASFIPNEVADLPLALCSVKAINVFDAFEQAENAISIELGLHALTSSRGKFFYPTNSDLPIITILKAPHMSIHDRTGKLSTKIFWYNNWPRKLSNVQRKPDQAELIFRNSEKVRNRLKNIPWRRDAELALARYYLAFSQSDLESSFLDGWRLLEAIAGQKVEKSQTLIKRASWFFADSDEKYQFGLHLLERRNLISHGRAIKDENKECLAFQMKELLTPIFHAFLTNPFNFRRKEEFWRFCDLPIDKGERERQTYLLNCAARFREEV